MQKYKDFSLCAVIICFAAFISVVVTGFNFGAGNNVFHIPYVLRLNETSSFYNDALYGSLDKFTSIIWPLMRLICNDQNIEKIFLVEHILSRALAFAALYWLFSVNDLRNRVAILLAFSVVSVCPWLLGESVVGGHGLFLDYFTHSEFTWGPLIAALVSVQLKKLKLAAIFSGVVFSMNAFIGIWLVVIFALITLADPRARREWRVLITSCTIFIMACLPVALWISMAITHNLEVPEFSYIEYIRVYYKEHFLIEDVAVQNVTALLIFIFCGAISALMMENKKFWLLVLIACLIVFLIGVIVPYVFNNRFIFNLHILRIDGVVQLLAVTLIIIVAVKILLSSGNSVQERAIATLTISSLMAQEKNELILIVAISLSYLAFLRFGRAVMLGSRFKFPSENTQLACALFIILIAFILDVFYIGMSLVTALRWVVTLVVIFLVFRARSFTNAKVVMTFFILLAMSVAATSVELRGAKSKVKLEKIASLVELEHWVRDSTLIGPFLFPLHDYYRHQFNEFQLLTRKTVWVDWKQGAAVMWDPSFYWQWMPRYHEVIAIENSFDLIAYAKDKKIPYVIIPKRFGSCLRDTPMIFENDAYFICANRSNN